MIKALLNSIAEAATSILANTEEMSNGEVNDIFPQGEEDELQKMDTALWELVEIIE